MYILSGICKFKTRKHSSEKLGQKCLFSFIFSMTKFNYGESPIIRTSHTLCSEYLWQPGIIFPPVFSFMVTLSIRHFLTPVMSLHTVLGGRCKLCVYPQLCQLELKICQFSHYRVLISQEHGVKKAAHWLLKSHNREYLLLLLDYSSSKSNYPLK